MYWEKMMKLSKWNNYSLRFRLIVTLSLVSVCVWLISTAVAWFQVRKEVNQMFDAQQILFAQRLASSDLRTILVGHHRGKPSKKRHGFKKPGYEDDALAFAIFAPDGDILLSDGENGENFIFAPARGFSKSRLREDDDEWRIFWLPVGDGPLMIAVGQEQEYRDDLVNEMVFGQMWIWFAGLPFLLLALGLVIRKELKSLKQIGEQVAKRTPDDASLLKTENIPTEILPLIQSLNQFFDRTSSMLLRERRFTSDAAHELRSPLAALRIQTEVAQIAGDDADMREQALDNLTQGIDRATQLIEQLLTLSRLDSLQELDNLQEIHWEQIVPSLIGGLYFHAEKRDITLEFEEIAVPAVKLGQPLLLSLMLRNLIDNAIRYCPQGSRIKVRLEKSKISVEDNGGGVDDADLAKLGQRFYRPAGQNEKGSGLGLSIVHRIAELHHYKVRLKNTTDPNGNRMGLLAEIQL
ncbi:two-component system sensor histidine kinase QseC [Aggregatibacter actinomycetemcomitans]|uniref:quorum sensing histidine kinase QseC n=1 Tax=Aggregatibacter actinomycetemcomitans TaxID=714 RepID=UPI00197B0828|nr:quorum sensing histidine kinase QseC [Aggregatibacter actinomycetemcomitans]MBN6067997.1 two-component system sensor histidine kinase QseC [Aggregatibacter actinomycetemcomitans]MBN6086690.1 two-component system sensor histidine kinase QseC [Aggregatibacter actinomycetemcomitans]